MLLGMLSAWQRHKGNFYVTTEVTFPHPAQPLLPFEICTDSSQGDGSASWCQASHTHTHTHAYRQWHLLPFLVDREALHSMHFASSSVVIATDLMNISFPLSFQTHTRHNSYHTKPKKERKGEKKKRKKGKETCIPSNNTKLCNIGNHTLVIPLEVWYGCVASEFHRWCQSSTWCRSLGQGCRG